MGKPKQQVKSLTEWGSIEDRELEVERRYATSPKTLEAWGLDRLQQCRDSKSGNLCQVISDVSYIPITLFPTGDKKDTTVRKNIDQIASDAVDEELAFMEEKRDRNRKLLFIGIIAAMLTLGVLILIFLQVKSGGGGVNIPMPKLPQL